MAALRSRLDELNARQGMPTWERRIEEIYDEQDILRRTQNALFDAFMRACAGRERLEYRNLHPEQEKELSRFKKDQEDARAEMKKVQGEEDALRAELRQLRGS